MLSQPEILEHFWPEWNPRTGRRGANPGIYAKALLTTTATGRISPFFDPNHFVLSHIPEWLEVYRWAEETSAIATGRQPNPLTIPGYEQAMKQVAKVAPGVQSAALLVDVITGLPLAWVVWDAAVDEARAVKHLLYVLYENWPDCPAEAIVAGGAWDEHWAVEWCLVNYGLHLIAPRSAGRDTAEYPLSRFDSDWISKYNGVGQLFCRQHGVP